MGWYIFLAVFIALLIPFIYLCYEYRNPFKLYMVFGKKGSGKTTFLAKTAYKYLKKGYPVYSTERIAGVKQFHESQIGYVTFPENSVILMDEVGMIWDNRNYKNFKEEVRNYFKFQRHERHTVYLFSQTFDVDVKLRNLTDGLYLCTCKFGWLSIARKISRSVTLVHPQGDAESRIADDLMFEPILWSLFGAKTCVFTYIPRWVSLFDSHEKLGLPMIEDVEPCPIPESAAKMFAFQNKDKKKSISFHILENFNKMIDSLNIGKIKEKYYDVFEDDYVEESDENIDEIQIGGFPPT